MDRRGLDFHEPIGDRTQEADRKGLAYRDSAICKDGESGGVRADAFDKAREYATMNDSHGLVMSVSHFDARNGPVGFE
jgi:hypothetical protein